MFSRIFHSIDAVKQTISEEEAAIELTSVFSKKKPENAKLSNSFEIREEPQNEG